MNVIEKKENLLTKNEDKDMKYIELTFDQSLLKTTNEYERGNKKLKDNIKSFGATDKILKEGFSTIENLLLILLFILVTYKNVNPSSIKCRLNYSSYLFHLN